MRIILPLILSLLGGLIGLGIHRLFPRSTIGQPGSMAIGAICAFFGLVLNSWMEFEISGDRLFDAVLASLSLALIGCVLANLFTNQKKNAE